MCIGKFNTAANATNRVGPDVKNLNGDTYGHSLQLILPVAVAIVMYFEQRVTQPPPELFRRHPALYPRPPICSLVSLAPWGSVSYRT